MKTIYHILFFLSMGFFLTGCDDNESGLPERNNLKLDVSVPEVVLTEDKQDETALTFSWNEATNIGEAYRFSYIFQADIANNNFQSATEPVTLQENGSYSLKTGDLYNLIVEKWKGVAGEPIYLDARVVAKVDGPKFQYPEIAYTKVKVTTYVPDSKPLYLLGTATDAGLDPTQAIKMNELSNGRLYNWKGKFKAGNYKFITTLGSMLPSYNKGSDDNTLVERLTETDPDEYFNVTEAATYYVHVSLRDMSMSCKKVLFETMYMVGDGCNAGWELSNMIAMQPDDVNPNVFTYQGALKEGELKMLTVKSDKWQVPTIRPKTADASITEKEVQLTPSDVPDHKWKITAEQAGLYKITLDVENMEILFEKQE